MRSLLVCFFLLFSSAVLADECRKYSYAPAAAEAGASIENPETGTDIENAFDQLYVVWSGQVTSRYKVSLWLAFDNDAWSEIAYCDQVFSNEIVPFCQSGSIFIHSSFATYGDNERRWYQISSFGTINRFSPDGIVPGDFFPTQFPLWGQSGWVDWPYPPEIVNQVYLVPIGGATASFTGLVGSSRSNAEPCGPCLSGSLPVPFATAYASAALGPTNPTTTVELQTQAQSLIKTMKGMTDEIFIEGYVGYANGEYYSLGDCRSSTQDCPTGTYSFYVAANSFFGNDDLHTMYLDEDGKIISNTLERGDFFNTTGRPWYVIGTGWAKSFTSRTTGLEVRSYSFGFAGGVAASEIELDSNGNCFQGRNGEYENSFYCAGEKVVMSLSLVLLAIVFALF